MYIDLRCYYCISFPTAFASVLPHNLPTPCQKVLETNAVSSNFKQIHKTKEAVTAVTILVPKKTSLVSKSPN